MKKVLILCGDSVNKKMAGPAIRCVEFAKVLSKKFKVTLAIPNDSDISFNEFTLKRYNNADPQNILNLTDENDIILANGFEITQFPFFKTLTKPIIFDIYVPLMLESFEFISKDEDPAKSEQLQRRATHIISSQLQVGDFFICASEKQRSYWLGMMSALGTLKFDTYHKDNSFRNLIDVVPFGINSVPPEHKKNVLKGKHKNINKDDFLFIWGGGIWNWFDPLTPIKAVAEIAKERNDIKLFFMGTTRPCGNIPMQKMCSDAMQLAKDLNVLDKFVFFNKGWIPYDDRENYLLEADCGITSHFNHIETEFSFRTRVLDYFWATLPVITTKGDTLADTIDRNDAGIVLDYEDVNGWKEAMLKMASNKEARQNYKNNVAKIAQGLKWDEICDPIIKFCEHPTKMAAKENFTGAVSIFPSATSEQTVTVSDAIINTLREKKNHLNAIEEKVNQLSNKVKDMEFMVADHNSFIFKVRNLKAFKIFKKIRKAT